MIIIHGMKTSTLPRCVAAGLVDRLSVMPAVVLTGARQTGKSTLARELVPGERRYHSLDDLDVLDAARRDPEALVGGTRPVTLDEVQREPDLLRAVKRAIDEHRRPGQFLLTGSANASTQRSQSPLNSGASLTDGTNRQQRSHFTPSARSTLTRIPSGASVSVVNPGSRTTWETPKIVASSSR